MQKTQITLLLLSFGVLINFGCIKKDTIYVKYEAKKENKKWTEKYGKYKNEKDGIFFNIKDVSNKTMSFFFNKENKVDTLCIKHLKDYRFLSLEEIDELRQKWIFENKRPPADRNGVFKTYLIEVISDKNYVIYPVIWRNEGVID